MRAVFVLVSLAAGYVAAQDFGTVAACGQQCFNNMKGKIAGCAVDNQKCHCDSTDYRNGLRDCVKQSCAAPDVPLVQSSLDAYVEGVCKAAGAPPAASAPSTSAAPSAAPTTSAPPPPPAAPTTSAPPPASTSAAPASSSSAPAPSSTFVTPVVPAAPSGTSTSSSSSSTGSPSSSASSSSASSSSTSAAAAGDASKSKSDSLSGATVAGIAIGSSALGIAVIGVLVCVFLHKRNNRRGVQGNDIDLNISQPMPGSGRTYAGDQTEKYEANNSSLDDFKSRRYEDMLPRQTPRTMV